MSGKWIGPAQFLACGGSGRAAACSPCRGLHSLLGNRSETSRGQNDERRTKSIRSVYNPGISPIQVPLSASQPAGPAWHLQGLGPPWSRRGLLRPIGWLPQGPGPHRSSPRAWDPEQASDCRSCQANRARVDTIRCGPVPPAVVVVSLGGEAPAVARLEATLNTNLKLGKTMVRPPLLRRTPGAVAALSLSLLLSLSGHYSLPNRRISHPSARRR